MKFKTTLTVLLFGTLWGFVEATLGGVMHLFEMPFTGLLMASFGFTVLHMAVRQGVKASHLFYISLVAASLKWLDVILFSLPALDRHIINPATAIASMGLAASLLFVWQMHSHKYLNTVLQTTGAVLIYFAGFNLVSAGLYGLPSSHMSNLLQSFALTLVLVPLVTSLLVFLLDKIKLPALIQHSSMVRSSLTVAFIVLTIVSRLLMA